MSFSPTRSPGASSAPLVTGGFTPGQPGRDTTAARAAAPGTGRASPDTQGFGAYEAHAAARWARAVVRILDAPGDPRTIAGWGRWIAVSPGALRNWCRTAGIRARHSLLFGRMLRAVHLSEGGRHKPENLLDVVDRRTLAALLAGAGFGGQEDFPRDVHEFLDRQRLVADGDALLELRRALHLRGL